MLRYGFRSYNFLVFKKRNTVGSPILSKIPYRTVPYRFPLEYFSCSRSLSARRPVFLPKIHRFYAQKVKSANRTVFKIMEFLYNARSVLLKISFFKAK
jgi:hypothetical protein